MVYVLFIVIALVSFAVQRTLQSKFERYSKIPIPYGLTGRDIAMRMLQENGINDVSVTQVDGHECGHAVQHARSYSFLNLRSALVPFVSFASNWVQWILLIGILTIQAYPAIMLLGIILFAATTLFSFITLPVEINASQRALAWLNGAGVTDASTQDKAKDALKWAAYTYVVAALGSLATLVYYIIIFAGGRRDS